MTKIGSSLFGIHWFTIIAAYLLLLADLSFSARIGAQLEDAILAKDEEAVKMLLAQGANIKLPNKNDSETTVLRKAADFQDKDLAIQVIKLLIDGGANVSTATDDQDVTFLHELFTEDGGALTPAQFQDVAVFLVSRDLSYLFNKPGFYNLGISPFHFAVKYIEIENGTLALLRNNSVNFNAADVDGLSILRYAVDGSRSTRLISDLISQGADPRHLDDDGLGLLHSAAMGNSVENIKFFVSLGLDINKMDGFYEMTPLHLAVRQGFNQVEKVRYLIKQQAKVNAKDASGKTPLEYVVDNYFEDDRDEMLSLLRNTQ